jgi:DNA-binding winged helix-turn-helix (wHTH) protein
MRTHDKRGHARDRMESAFAGPGSRASEPRSASIHLLNSSTRVGQNLPVVRSEQLPPALRNGLLEFRADIDGLPFLVRFLVKDVPPQVQSDFVERNRIASQLSNTLDKIVGRIRGYSSPSDDASKQPLAILELISSGESPVRIHASPNETVLRVGSLELDLLDRIAKRGNRQIDLRPREFRLLKYMMERSDQLLTRAMLLKEVWHYNFVPETNLVDVHMGRLRRKVDGPDETPIIRNVRGAGFVLGAAPPSQVSPWRPAERSGNLAIADQPSRPLERVTQ